MFSIDYNRNYVPRTIFWTHRRAGLVNSAAPAPSLPDRAIDRPSGEGYIEGLSRRTATSSSSSKARSYAPIQAFVPFSVWHEPIVGLLVDKHFMDAVEQPSKTQEETKEEQDNDKQSLTEEDVDQLLLDASTTLSQIREIEETLQEPPAAPLLQAQSSPDQTQVPPSSPLEPLQLATERSSGDTFDIDDEEFIGMFQNPDANLNEEDAQANLSPVFFDEVPPSELTMTQRIQSYYDNLEQHYPSDVCFLFRQVPPMYLVGKYSQVQPTMDIFCTNIETSAYFNYMHKYYRGCNRYHRDRCNSVDAERALDICGRKEDTVFSMHEIAQAIKSNPFTAFDHLPLSNALMLGNNAFQRLQYSMLDIVDMDLKYSMPTYNMASELDFALRDWMKKNNEGSTKNYPYYEHAFYREYAQKLIHVYSLLASVKTHIVNHGFSYWRYMDTHDAHRIVLCPDSDNEEDNGVATTESNNSSATTPPSSMYNNTSMSSSISCDCDTGVLSVLFLFPDIICFELNCILLSSYLCSNVGCHIYDNVSVVISVGSSSGSPPVPSALGTLEPSKEVGLKLPSTNALPPPPPEELSLPGL